jgi:hypothetical protein
MFNSRKRLLCLITRLPPILGIIVASRTLLLEALLLNESALQNDQAPRKSTAGNRDDSKLETAQKYESDSRIHRLPRPSPRQLLKYHLSKWLLRRIRAHLLPQANIIHRQVMVSIVATRLQLHVARRVSLLPTIACRVRYRHPLCRRSLLVLRTGRSLSRRNLKMIQARHQRTALIPAKPGKVEIRRITIVWRLRPHYHPTSVLRGITMAITPMEAG